MTEPAPPAPGLREPWRSPRGAVWRRRDLLLQFTRKQRATRLHGTRLGLTWDYINPIVQFSVYFFVIGILLGLEKSVENFPLYIFSGLVTVQFFIGGLNGATTAFTRHRLVIRRAVFPRQILIASEILNGLVALGPPMLILLLASVAYGVIAGYHFEPAALAAAVGGMVLLGLFTYGLGLITSVANVFVRDTNQVVGVITTLARWAVPIIYPWTLVPDRFGDGLLSTLYFANPVTIAVFGVREAFWMPTLEQGLPPLPTDSLVVGLSIVAAVVLIGIVVLHRYNDRVVQRLRWTT